MRRIDMRVRADDVPVAFDRLLPHLRGGLHPMPDGEDVVLVALGERGELPPPSALEELAGDVLIGDAVERDAGADLGTALAALSPRWEIGGRVVLRTPDHEAPPPELIDVVLSRDQGFGTGAHPTTRHCIELMLDIAPGGSFADLGCGAGALSIAAFKLGFAPILGVDLLDPVCVNAARNGDANGIDADFLARDLLTLSRLEMRVIAMNISELDVHLHLATNTELPEIEWLVVSGLDHPGKLAHAIATYEEAGFEERRRID
ncbi:MAG: ribosomal protein methyltransferase, partial [bacterium]